MRTFIIGIILTIFLAGTATALGKSDGKIINRKVIGKKDNVQVIKLTYLSDELKVNGLLFLPPSDKKLPCVIFCHDGIKGISKEHRLSSIRLAKAGYVVFAPSYRGEDGSEGKIEIAKGEVRDVLNAINMISNIKEADRDRIALAGASHGALICALAASRTGKIKALIFAYGVADIYKWWKYLKDNNKLGNDRFTRQTYGDGPDDRPQSFLIRNAVSYVKNIKCPVLILQGKKDETVPPEQAQFLKEALDKSKVLNEIKIYPDCLHGFLIYAPYDKNSTKEEKAQTEESWKVMLEFLERNL